MAAPTSSTSWDVSCRDLMSAHLDRIERLTALVDASAHLRPREELRFWSLAYMGPSGYNRTR